MTNSDGFQVRLRLSSAKGLWHTPCIVFLLGLTICTFAPATVGQTVTVRLINGRNGKPLSRVKTAIGFDNDKNRQFIILYSDLNGELHFEADQSRTIYVHPIGVIDCGEQPVGAPDPNYSIAEILKNGLLTRNNCGKGNYEPLRGKLLYFGRRASWWEMFKI